MVFEVNPSEIGWKRGEGWEGHGMEHLNRIGWECLMWRKVRRDGIFCRESSVIVKKVSAFYLGPNMPQLRLI